MAQQTIHVRGLRELNRSFRDIDRGLHTALRSELMEVARPVQETSHVYALDRIRNMTDPWSEFRIGVTQRLVYVAPKQRGRKRGSRRRENFARLLAERSMEPALADNQTQIVSRLEAVLDSLARIEGF